jgi:sulfate adenylyltransferase
MFKKSLDLGLTIENNTQELSFSFSLQSKHLISYRGFIIMNNIEHSEPHGGTLVNLLADSERCKLLKDISLKLPDITLNERQLCDLELLATGVFSPLKGFMVRSDYESVLDRMRLQNNMLWPIPVCLDITNTKASTIEAGQSVTLRDPEGFLLAIMHIEDFWEIEREKESLKIYGTLDQTHPGVNYLFNKSGDYYIGGKLEVLNLPIHFDFKQMRMAPEEVTTIYKKLGWKRVVGFQTRNPIHRPQFEMTIKAMQQAGANLLILPITGIVKADDFDHYIRVRCYREVTNHYPPDFLLIKFTTSCHANGRTKRCTLRRNYIKKLWMYSFYYRT